jgi:hypothetical protein
MQDDIYRGIGATDRPDVDGGEADPRAEARRMATDLTRGGTQPLRDELARDVNVSREGTRDMARDLAMGGTQPLRDELERDRVRAAKGKTKGGY